MENPSGVPSEISQNLLKIDSLNTPGILSEASQRILLEIYSGGLSLILTNNQFNYKFSSWTALEIPPRNSLRILLRKLARIALEIPPFFQKIFQKFLKKYFWESYETFYIFL